MVFGVVMSIGFHVIITTVAVRLEKDMQARGAEHTTGCFVNKNIIILTPIILLFQYCSFDSVT